MTNQIFFSFFSDGSPVDCNEELENAIQEAAKSDQKMNIEKIEIQQQSTIN